MKRLVIFLISVVLLLIIMSFALAEQEDNNQNSDDDINQSHIGDNNDNSDDDGVNFSLELNSSNNDDDNDEFEDNETSKIKVNKPRKADCEEFTYSTCPLISGCFKECVPTLCTQVNETGQVCTSDCDGQNSCYNLKDIVEKRKENKEKLKGKLKRVLKRFDSMNETNCPEKCTCTGSVTKCELNNGREMTITAGNSGNTIVQTKGEKMTTTVYLYKENNTIYGLFKGNVTKKILLPDKVEEKIMEKLKIRLENKNITLDEFGMYNIEAHQKTRILGLFPAKKKVSYQVDAQTGEITKTKEVWWAFMAKEVKEKETSQPILGASCGTVTPGYNDECCQNKGYDVYNNETNQCE